MYVLTICFGRETCRLSLQVYVLHETAFTSTSFATHGPKIIRHKQSTLLAAYSLLLPLLFAPAIEASTNTSTMSASTEPPMTDTNSAPSEPDLSDGQCIICGNPTNHKCSDAKGFSWCHKLSYCRKDCRSVAPAAKEEAYDQALQDYTSTLDRKLTRIAGILHEAVITFLANTWTGYLRAFEEKDGKLYIYDSEVTHRPQWFAKFPQHLFRDNKNAKAAVLTENKCEQVHACLYTLITKPLQGKRRP